MLPTTSRQSAPSIRREAEKILGVHPNTPTEIERVYSTRSVLIHAVIDESTVQ